MPLITRYGIIRREDLRAEPEAIFLFGDNEARAGFGGQAGAMRGEPNALGIRTKRRPGTEPDDYWTNGDDATARQTAMVDEDLAVAEKHLVAGRAVYLPESGLGTGLAELPRRAPRTFAHLKRRLLRLHIRYTGAHTGLIAVSNVKPLPLTLEQMHEAIREEVGRQPVRPVGIKASREFHEALEQRMYEIGADGSREWHSFFGIPYAVDESLSSGFEVVLPPPDPDLVRQTRRPKYRMWPIPFDI